MGNKWEQVLEQFRDVEPFLVENSDLSNTTQTITYPEIGACGHS